MADSHHEKSFLSSAGGDGAGTHEYGGYIPIPSEIVNVRNMLMRAKRLPADIVDEIFDAAEYWPCSRNEIDFIGEHGDRMRINGDSTRENKFLVRSVPVGLLGLNVNQDLAQRLAYDTNLPRPWPLQKEHDPGFFTRIAGYRTPRLIYPVRKVVFKLRCRGQEQGGLAGRHGTFRDSHTWLEAGLERFEAETTCNPHCVPDVRYASRASQAPELPVCSLRPVEPPLRLIQSRPDPGQGQETRGCVYEYAHAPETHDLLTIQKNRIASWEYADYTITWRWDDMTADPDSEEATELENAGRGKTSGSGEFVRSLKMGDVVTIWGKARRTGCVNEIERVGVDIYWAV